jgi:TolB-like protein
MSFYSELKRRNVIRVGTAYAVATWLLVQVADTTFPLFGFGNTPARIVVILLIIGFIPALIFAWAFELTESGIQREDEVDRSLKVTTKAAKRLDRIIMFVLALALGYFAIDKFVLSESREQIIAERAREQAMQVAVEQYRNNESIAVLPFVDLSPDQDQEYFGDGVAEQLLDELTRLEGLNVASRTSSFAFKDKNQDLKVIGEALGVANILEGSVRKDGDELLITAQLIDVESGFHRWSNTFNRRLDDIFKIQDEIAKSVAGALSIELKAAGREHLAGAGTDNIDAYDAFLEGMAWFRLAQPDIALPHFERALQLDSDYAEAVLAIAGVYGRRSFNLAGDDGRALQQQGLEYVLQAIEMNPEFAVAYSRLAAFHRAMGNWIDATKAYEKAKALAPGDSMLQLTDSFMSGRMGRINDAINFLEIGLELKVIGYYGFQTMALQYTQVGRYDEAREVLLKSKALSVTVNPSIIKRHLFIALSEGDAAAIKIHLAEFAGAYRPATALAEAVLGAFDSGQEAIQAALRKHVEDSVRVAGDERIITASIAAYAGDAQFALQLMTEELRANKIRITRLWMPYFSDMRRLQGFKDLVTELNMVEFWREYGWADFCRPLKSGDFECY